MRRKWLYILLAGIVWLVFLTSLEIFIRERSVASVLDMDICMSEKFREQKLSSGLYRKLKEMETEEISWTDLLTASMLDGDFSPEDIPQNRDLYLKYKEKEYIMLWNLYRAVWEDIRFFPVAAEDISFENTWMASRDYGGKRFHEGTDLFGEKNLAGYYPVISMTDGTVEKTGWLPLGGCRIGVRSPSGGYFYYAHLSSYAEGLSEGGEVEAGDILGYMGNTGYGPEGTSGKFPVHLHLGIYISTPYQEEMSVNPYWALKIFEKKIRKYTY